MRSLMPVVAEDVDPHEFYRPGLPASPDRPFVRVNMISSLDGAVAVQGRSGVLGGPADRRVFSVLRSWADVILVGAGTVRAEGYGPARLSDHLRDQRRERGQPPVPPIAVVTSTGRLDWSTPFFREAEQRPIVVSPADIDPEVRDRAAAAADVLSAGEGSVDLAAALLRLHGLGHHSVLVEGGPRLNAQLARGELVDELCLTLSPRIVAGDGPRVLAGAELSPPLSLETACLLEEDGFFFHRLRVLHGASGTE